MKPTLKSVVRALPGISFALLMIAASHGSEVGAVAAQHEVGNDGSANYTIPVNVPTGIQGIQPQLALSYNSNGGNGLVGVGWGISGLSSIHRCATNIERDGYLDGVDFDDNDQFCLDGQRLVAISGAYGANGTEYRTEHDTISKIVSYGSEGTSTPDGGTANNPQYFKVWTKDGRIHQYGNNNQSRSSRTLSFTTAGCPAGYVVINIYGSVLCYNSTTGDSVPYGVTTTETRTYDWAVNQIADRYGNKLVYSYFDDDANGEHYITRINYNHANGGTGTAQNSVRFTYGARNDTSSGYFAGAIMNQTKRLTHIATYADNTKLRELKLTYLTNSANSITDDSRLESVKECANNLCVEPTTFSWDVGEAGFSGTVTNTGINNAGWDNNPHVMDVNGDGRQDLVQSRDGKWRIMLSNGQTFPTEVTTNASSTNWENAKTFRYDNDNKDDILIRKNGHWYVLKGTVTSTQTYTYTDYLTGQPVTVTIPGSPTFTEVDTQIDVYNESTSQLLDVDGDGRKDLLYLHNGVTKLHFLGDNGFGGAQATNVTTNLSKNTTWVMDYNGDGMEDILKASGGYWQVYVSNGDATFTLVNTGIASTGYDKSPKIGDFNGDGLSDVILRYNGNHYVLLNKGGEFAPARQVATDIGSSNWNHAVSYDYNADGQIDFLYTQNGYWHVMISDGEVYNKQMASPTTANSGWDNQPIVMDITGNGMQDLVLAYSGKWYIRLHKGLRPDYMTEAENGLGVKTRFYYKVLTDPTDPSFYNRGAEVSYPVRSIQNASYLVAKVEQSNGVGGFNSTSYQYKKLLMHLQGLGNLGFEEMTTINNDTGIKTQVTFSQDWNAKKQGAVTKVITTNTANNKVLSDTVNFWNTVTYGSGDSKRYQRRITKTTITKRDLNGAFLHKEVNDYTNYDSYNNLKTLTSKVYDASNVLLRTKTTNNTYSYTSSTWLVGLLTKSVVTVDGTASGQAPITRKSAWEYYSTGRMKAEKILNPTSEAVLSRTDYENIDGYGNAKRTKISGPDFEARETNILFDGTGRYVTSTTNAIGHTATTTYYGDGNINAGLVNTVTDANGLKTKHDYDAMGRQTKVTAAYGTAYPVSTYTRYEWCADMGGVCPANAVYGVTTTKDGGGESRVFFDMLGRKVRESTQRLDGQFAHIDYEYNAKRHNHKVTEPYYHGQTQQTTTLVYDALGRITKSTYPDGRVDTVTFNGLTRTSKVDIYGKNQQKIEYRNALGELTRVRDNDSNDIDYTYDSLGSLKTVTDPGNNVTTISYDELGRKVSMDDPDKGLWRYTYNGLGLLITQTDAKGIVTCNAYDKLARMIYRYDDYQGTVVTGLGQSGESTNQCAGHVDNATKSTWSYDTASGAGKGKLHKAFGHNGYQEIYTYDSYGQTTQFQQIANGDSYNINTSYDAYHRVNITTYPGPSNRLKIKNIYNSNGFLTKLRNAANNDDYYSAETMDARGNITYETYENGLVTERVYDAQTGRLEHIYGKGEFDTAYTVQELDYQFDNLGNLTYRRDHLQGFTEDFTYDNLNRLTGNAADFGNGEINNTVVAYDNLGNITNKTGVGLYSYGGTCNGIQAGPHAVTSIYYPKHTSYCYDANGNMTSGDGRTIDYTHFNKPGTVITNNVTTTIKYGPDRARYQRVEEGNGRLVTYNYVGGIYEKVKLSNDDVEERHYVGGVAVVTYTNRTANNAGTLQTRYLHKDHLGSTTLITDEVGNIVEEFSFDPWGKRRAPNLAALVAELGAWNTLNAYKKANLTISALTLSSTVTNRGFTGHEQLDPVGLIHMNGRVYDAEIGRFISADPFIQDRTNLQALNRYSYVQNNPLSYTDPSGFFLKKLFKKVESVIKNAAVASFDYLIRKPMQAIARAIGKVEGLSTVITISLNFVPGCQGWCSALFNAAMTAANGGTIADILKGSAIAFVTQSVGNAIASGIGDVVGVGAKALAAGATLAAKTVNAAGQVLASGISAKALGGKFIDGVKGVALGLAISYGMQRLMVGDGKAESFGGKESPQQGQSSGGDKNSTSLDVSEVADINGGTADQVAGITNDLKDIFGTERGQEMLDTLNAAGKKVTINVNDQGVLNGGDFLVNIDPNSHPIIETTAGLIPASTRRILAHELGHAVMGMADNGPNNMNNVINNENRIMGELGRPRRTAY